MGDRTSASISIGGLLSHALTPDLIHAIRADGGRADWEGSFLKSGDIVTGQVIEAHAFDLNGGHFRHHRRFLRFKRHTVCSDVRKLQWRLWSRKGRAHGKRRPSPFRAE